MDTDNYGVKAGVGSRVNGKKGASLIISTIKINYFKKGIIY